MRDIFDVNRDVMSKNAIICYQMLVKLDFMKIAKRFFFATFLAYTL